MCEGSNVGRWQSTNVCEGVMVPMCEAKINAVVSRYHGGLVVWCLGICEGGNVAKFQGVMVWR